MMHLSWRVFLGILLCESSAFAQFGYRHLTAAAGEIRKASEQMGDSSLTELPKVIMNEFPDGTVSWGQPDDRNRVNGRCGETAAANIVSMVYRKTSPLTVSQNMSDVTPGTRPATLSQFLNHFMPGSWSVQTAQYEDALNKLYRALRLGDLKAKNNKAPVAVLLQQRPLTLHWVTVVDIDLIEKHIIYQEDGMQMRSSFTKFMQEWGFRTAQGTSGVAIRTTLRNTCCLPYTFVAQ